MVPDSASTTSNIWVSPFQLGATLQPWKLQQSDTSIKSTVDTALASTQLVTNSVNIRVDVVRQIIVDDMRHLPQRGYLHIKRTILFAHNSFRAWMAPLKFARKVKTLSNFNVLASARRNFCWFSRGFEIRQVPGRVITRLLQPHLRNVQPTSRHISGHQEGALPTGIQINIPQKTGIWQLHNQRIGLKPVWNPLGKKF